MRDKVKILIVSTGMFQYNTIMKRLFYFALLESGCKTPNIELPSSRSSKCLRDPNFCMELAIMLLNKL